MELFKDAEGKSRGCGVVEFKDEEFVKKALETMNKYDLSGRPSKAAKLTPTQLQKMPASNY